MKFCPLCNGQYPDGDRCPTCNIPLLGGSDPVGGNKKGGRGKAPADPIYPDPFAQEEPAPARQEPQRETAAQDPAPSRTPQSEADLYGFGPEVTGGDQKGGRNSGSRDSRDRRERESRREREQRPQREKRERTARNSSGGGIDTRIVMIAGIIIAAVVVVLILLLVVIPHAKNKKMADDPFTDNIVTEDFQDDAEGNIEAANPDDQDEYAEENGFYTTDFSWGDVDIDATVDNEIDLYGYFRSADDGNADDYKLALEDSYNIALSYYGEDVMVPDVSEILVQNYSQVNFDDYTSAMVTVHGFLYMDDESVWFEGTDISSDEVELASVGQVGVHSYSYYKEDVSWAEAYNRAIQAGGHLATIESEEEFNVIASDLSAMGYTADHVYLGGRRDDGGDSYYWVDTNNAFMGDCLNTTVNWSNPHWYGEEPSFIDIGSDAQGEIQENRIGLFCVNGTWYLNDMSDDLLYYYQNYDFHGKIVYVVEFE